jgi:hypothetical protein
VVPTRALGPAHRYRLLLWLDADEVPLQAAVALFHGDIKLTETTYRCEPFDTCDDALRAGVHALDRQLSLWSDPT